VCSIQTHTNIVTTGLRKGHPHNQPTLSHLFQSTNAEQDEKAIKNLENRTKKAGQCRLVWVIISHPSAPNSNALGEAVKKSHPLATVALDNLEQAVFDLGQTILLLAVEGYDTQGSVCGCKLSLWVSTQRGLYTFWPLYIVHRSYTLCTDHEMSKKVVDWQCTNTPISDIGQSGTPETWSKEKEPRRNWGSQTQEAKKRSRYRDRWIHVESSLCFYQSLDWKATPINASVSLNSLLYALHSSWLAPLYRSVMQWPGQCIAAVTALLVV